MEYNDDFPIDRECIIDQSVAAVRAAFEKYKDDVYMTSRIYRLVCSQLPAMLENIDKLQAERQERASALTTERDAFVDAFLERCPYFFCDKTDRFFYYDGDRYSTYSEDDILHRILSGISSRPSILMNWKRRTKTYVMQRIKSNHILSSIPESDTIQRVIGILSPMLFATRAEAKYFLTIAGDSMLRKTTTAVHLISIHAKTFVTSLNQICLFMFGVSVNASFKYKYHDHDYAQCRIVGTGEGVRAPGLWGSVVAENALDILCVAAHYSSRYDNAESYVTEFASLEDESLRRSVCFLKDRTKEDVVTMFVDSYIEFSGTGAGGAPAAAAISWKNLHYLWKHFLRSRGLPSIIFQNSLKELCLTEPRLNKTYRATEDAEEFVGVFSKYLPGVDAFLRFWADATVADEDEGELEVEEVAILFKRWCAGAAAASQCVNTRTIPDILSHYFPYVEVCDGKYIHGVRCTEWDKQEDIRGAIVSMMAEESPPQSMYVYYCAYCKSHGTHRGLVVSKSYFERYLAEHGFPIQETHSLA
jgi:hypothetical protein